MLYLDDQLLKFDFFFQVMEDANIKLEQLQETMLPCLILYIRFSKMSNFIVILFRLVIHNCLVLVFSTVFV